jgi:hypothetical protein
MERYCQEHPGTYSFWRSIYAGLSSHAKENCVSIEELETFERLHREKIAKL